MLTKPVRFSLQSEGPVGNIFLCQTAVKLGHGAGMHFDSILRNTGSDFLLSTCTGGWHKDGKKIDLEKFNFPGNKNEELYCTFFLSPTLLDPKSKIETVDISKLININVNPEQYNQ